MSPAQLGTTHHAPNAALLIDFDNVTMGIRSELQTELKNLLSSDIVKGKVSVQRAYADWRRYPQYVVPLAEASIDMENTPSVQMILRRALFALSSFDRRSSRSEC